MARIQTRGRGQSASRRPVKSENPDWVQLEAKEVEDLIVKYRRDGASSGQIGLNLRDLHAVPSIKLATGKSLAQVLKENDLAGDVPDDLMALMRKAVNLARHLAKNSKDTHNKHSLQNVEAKIRRLVAYYQSRGDLPMSWRYSLNSAKLIVE